MGDMARIDEYLNGVLGNRSLSDDEEQGIRLNEFEVYGICDLLGIGRCPAGFVSLDADPSAYDKWLQDGAGLVAGENRLLLKVVGRDILHKTEIGGVRVLDFENVSDPESHLRDKTDDLK